MALRIKRGTNAQRTAYTPEQGELIFVTDYNTAGVSPLWLGDGSTVGGVEISSAGGGGGLTQVADDTTPELGGNLSLAGYEINGIGDINITGAITATGFITANAFVGDGSGLTGVTAQGPYTGDLTGSVFADDSTLLVDGLNGKVVGQIETTYSSLFLQPTTTVIQSTTSGSTALKLEGYGNTYDAPSVPADFAKLGVNFSWWDGAAYTDSSLITGFHRTSGAGYIALTSKDSSGTYYNTAVEIDGEAGIVKLTSATSVDVVGALTVSNGITGDLVGSVFADDSTLLVDALNGTINLSNTTISSLSDVTISNPQSGQVLKWNGSAWVNDVDVSGSGTGGSAFTNIGIGADDSTIRLINEGESFLILGGTGITTASDAEGNITITGFGGAFADLSGTPTTLAGYGITDAATSAQGALADTAIQPADLGSFTLLGSTLDTSDSSGIVITPAVTMSSDLTVENNLTVTNTVTAERFVSAATGTPEIESATNLNLTAGNAVVITSSPLRLASFTTAERDALAAQNGDIIYNTTLNKFQGYENGAWANLI